MTSKRAPIVAILVLGVSAAASALLGPVQDYLLQLTPISIYRLPGKAYLAMAATIAASLAAWVVAVLVGMALGMFSAAGALASRETDVISKAWSQAAGAIRGGYEWLFVIPMVLTVSFVATLLLKAFLEGFVSRLTVGVALIFASGVILAGQRVYVAIDDAIHHASDEDLLLARSLHLGSSLKWKSLDRVVRILRETRFLVGCRISLLAQALVHGFHLAVVGVVITETVSGQRVYEWLFPQEAGVLPWGGGIGRIIMDGQNYLDPTLVAGAVWLILIFDTSLAFVIRAAIDRYWVSPYRRAS